MSSCRCQDCKETFDSPQARAAHVGNTDCELDRVLLTCERCGSDVKKVPSVAERSERHFCDDNCYREWLSSEHNATGKDAPSYMGGKEEFECGVCGAAVERWQSQVYGVVVCSTACFGEIHSKKMSGEGNPQWKPAFEREYGEEWVWIREAVIQLDDSECKSCGISREQHVEDVGRDLSVHHIEPLRRFEMLWAAHDLRNLVTMCQSCHRTIENFM